MRAYGSVRQSDKVERKPSARLLPPRGDKVSPQEAGPLRAGRRRPWTRRPPSLLSFQRTLLDDERVLFRGVGRSLGDRRLTAGSPGTALARLDSELHQLLAGEAEDPPQMGRRPPPQALTPLLHALAPVDDVLQPAAHHLLLDVQRLRLDEQRVQLRGDLLEEGPLPQEGPDAGAQQLPEAGASRKRDCLSHLLLSFPVRTISEDLLAFQACNLYPSVERRRGA